MTRHLVTVPPARLEDAKDLMQAHKIEKLLVVDGEKRLRGLITSRNRVDEPLPAGGSRRARRLVCGAAVGVAGDRKERIAALVEAGVDVIRHRHRSGHSKGVLDAARDVKSRYPDLALVVGNVAPPRPPPPAIDHGADVVKSASARLDLHHPRGRRPSGSRSSPRPGMRCRASAGKPSSPTADQYSGDVPRRSPPRRRGDDRLAVRGPTSPPATPCLQGRRYKTYRGMG